MMGHQCKCPHHWVAWVLTILAWIAAFGFFYVQFAVLPLWGFDADFYFASVIILVLLPWSMKICGCCRKHVMVGKIGGGVCTHEPGCKCGDCERCR